MEGLLRLGGAGIPGMGGQVRNILYMFRYVCQNCVVYCQTTHYGSLIIMVPEVVSILKNVILMPSLMHKSDLPNTY